MDEKHENIGTQDGTKAGTGDPKSYSPLSSNITWTDLLCDGTSGLNSQGKQAVIRELQSRYNLQILAILETRVSKISIER